MWSVPIARTVDSASRCKILRTTPSLVEASCLELNVVVQELPDHDTVEGSAGHNLTQVSLEVCTVELLDQQAPQECEQMPNDASCDRPAAQVLTAGLAEEADPNSSYAVPRQDTQTASKEVLAEASTPDEALDHAAHVAAVKALMEQLMQMKLEVLVPINSQAWLEVWSAQCHKTNSVVALVFHMWSLRCKRLSTGHCQNMM